MANRIAQALRHQITSVILIAGALALLAGSVVHRALNIRRTGDTEDFRYFYNAALAMLRGQDIYAATDGRYLYPPFLAFVFQPLALMPEFVAAMVWAVITALMVGAALVIASSEACKRWSVDDTHGDRLTVFSIAAGALILFGEKIHANFTLGQTDAIMLLGFACVLRWRQRRPLLAGTVVGLTANVKYLSLICVPYFLYKRNYRAAISSCVAFVFFMLLPAVEIGAAQSAQFISGAFRGLSGMMGGGATAAGDAGIYGVEWGRSISITSALFRFTRSRGMADTWAVLLVGAVCIAILAALVLIARRRGVRLFARDDESGAVITLEWAILIFLAVAFSPQSTARHVALIMLAFVVALAVLRRAARSPAGYTLVASMTITLLGLSTPWRELGFRDFARAWRNVGGASWCALLMILALVWCGACALRQTARRARDV